MNANNAKKAFIEAVESGDAEFFEKTLLLHPVLRGMRLSMTGMEDASLLHLMVMKRLPRFVKVCIAHDMDIDEALRPNGYTPLILAVFANEVETVELLLKSGADANAHDTFGYTALHYAVQRENRDVVAALLRRRPRYKVIQNHLVANFCAVPIQNRALLELFDAHAPAPATSQSRCIIA